MEWLLPHVRVADHIKIPLLNLIKADKTLTLTFRMWTLYEYPMLSTTTRHVWAAKTSPALEKPHFVILGFQTNRQNKKDQNASHFDHARLRDVKLYLNSQCYPYANLNLDITNNQFALFYDMYSHFQSEYYSKEEEPLLSRSEFFKLRATRRHQLLQTKRTFEGRNGGCPFGVQIVREFSCWNNSLLSVSYTHLTLPTNREV